MNTCERICGFLKSKCGYFASFVIGGVLMSAFTLYASPYTVARWVGVYEYTILGSLITSDEAILQTRQIPQDVVEWYESTKG